MTKTSAPKKATTSKGLAKFAANEPRGSAHTPLLGISGGSIRAKPIEGVPDDRDKSHRLYLRCRSQRSIALKNVIKRYQQLEDAERFLETHKAFHSDTEGYVIPDDFFDSIANTKGWCEFNLEVAIVQLAVAHQRLHDVISAGEGSDFVQTAYVEQRV
jgi:hypothetical protein